ncbi:MAG TPA: acetylxylan esterase, partial [Opitutaceae bacterium]
MKRFTALWMYGIVFVTVLAVHAKAQNLLPFNWKVRFASGPVPGLPPPATDGYYPVNLLYSWERQGFSSIDGPGKLVCDFALPSGQISSGMALSIHLLCRIERVSINGKQLHGAIPATSWTGGPETKILIPDGFLKPGENRIEMDVSELGYTGGLSHNFCRLTFDKLTASVDPSVSIEVASANHIFVDTKPTARVHYHALRPGHLQVSIASDFHDKVYARSFSVAAGEGSIPMDLDSLAGKPGFYECTAMLDSGGFAGAVEWIGVSPERIECRSVTQKSTDSYWTEALNELHTVNGNFRIHKVAEWCTADREGYVVEMKSIGDVLITGYYFIPKSPGPHAAIMHVPGYGQRFRPTDFISNHDNVAELGLFVRGHEPNSPGRFEPPNGPTLWGYKIYDEHEYAYRGVY